MTQITDAPMTSTHATNTTHASDPAALLAHVDTFVRRHIGPSQDEIAHMLDTLGFGSLDALSDAAVPTDIRLDRPLAIGGPRGEHELLLELSRIAGRNQVFRSCIGMGYHHCVTPPVVLRNVLENPGWYTQYTPYQAEIAQGRLEALLNFQTVVADLTGLPLAGASLLDEGTAAAEAMGMCFSIAKQKKPRFLIAADCHPQTIEVVRTRAHPLGVVVEVATPDAFDFSAGDVCGVLLQYPTTDGRIEDYKDLTTRAHDAGATVACATDLLALTLIEPPGAWGADIAVGSAQRFGVPMGLGGPHAGFLATREEHARRMPGRIIGVSRDVQGNRALRMAIQTREQHIKRERATSNICTAQALLAIMAGFYAAYHGPDGLRAIANRVHAHTAALIKGLERLGHTTLGDTPVFDTLRVKLGRGRTASHARQVHDAARERSINLRAYDDGTIGIALDETVDRALIESILAAFNFGSPVAFSVDDLLSEAEAAGLLKFADRARTSDFMTHPVFTAHHSETEMLRYITMLQRRDLSLADSMIPLGSCTMKLNATSEMLPVTWAGFADIHPFAPDTQWRGYTHVFRTLERWLADITGFPAICLQPNAGAQGEYAGLMVIKAYHEHQGDTQRDVCLIPTSAHGTNPASAVMAGMRVVAIKCDERGNIDMADLRDKAAAHADALAALMVTYPSTHGVFEATIREVCDIVHDHGGKVYMDGANMNAQVGLTSPARCGADVCHLNLHKTFCIPHGGGGPGMGPIGVTDELAPFLPTHPVERPDTAGEHAIGPIAAAPYGSPLILTISWVYIALMGSAGLTRATQVAILNANYMAKRLEDHYNILYRGARSLVAHEFIIDCRAFEKSAGVKIDDIAKRLIDYGFHAPTMAWPVPGTLMIEPTESEPMHELDRLCDALIAIRAEIEKVSAGDWPRDDNPLVNAPHTIAVVSQDDWPHPYPRETAAYPATWLRNHKFWAHVGRVDNPYGDRNLICSCPPVEDHT